MFWVGKMNACDGVQIRLHEWQQHAQAHSRIGLRTSMPAAGVRYANQTHELVIVMKNQIHRQVSTVTLSAMAASSMHKSQFSALSLSLFATTVSMRVAMAGHAHMCTGSSV
jgi:hypothetical protein